MTAPSPFEPTHIFVNNKGRTRTPVMRVGRPGKPPIYVTQEGDEWIAGRGRRVLPIQEISRKEEAELDALIEAKSEEIAANAFVPTHVIDGRPVRYELSGTRAVDYPAYFTEDGEPVVPGPSAPAIRIEHTLPRDPLAPPVAQGANRWQVIEHLTLPIEQATTILRAACVPGVGQASPGRAEGLKGESASVIAGDVVKYCGRTKEGFGSNYTLRIPAAVTFQIVREV